MLDSLLLRPSLHFTTLYNTSPNYTSVVPKWMDVAGG